MGLPLFIAPVESDLSSKPVNKTRTTSPPRTSIRRPNRDSLVGYSRRGPIRIYSGIRHHTPRIGEPERSPRRLDPEAIPGRSERTQRRHSPAVEYSTLHMGNEPMGSLPMPTESERRPFREALREVTTRAYPGRRERMEDHMSTLFGSSWRELAADGRREGSRPNAVDLGWFSLEPESRARRIRTRNADEAAQNNPNHERTWVPSEAPPSSNSWLSGPPRIVRVSSSSRDQTRYRSARFAGPHPSRRSVPPRRGPGVDGLGDRERSLSPEVWDTLLSTLTPDPQPPSASSSFASGAASQGAGPSSNTNPPTPRFGIEQGLYFDVPTPEYCDSGCEHSDQEDGDAEGNDRPRTLLRRRSTNNAPSHRSSRRRQPPTASRSADGPEDVDMLVRPSGGTDATSETMEPAAPSARDRVGSPHPLLYVPAPPDGWVGRLSIGAHDEDASTDRRRSQTREGSAVSGQNTSGQDEDWSGMRRIVRSLARREDIPEEWWAEAGLSRTLPREDTN